MKSDGGELSRLVGQWAGGVYEEAATRLEVMRSRFEAWSGVSGVRVRRCEEPDCNAGEQRLPQEESKCAQASGARELAVPSDSWRATTCRVPRLHWGQDRLSADFCGSVSSALMSRLVAWRWILHRARAWRRLRLASK
jgi:hypothetical protein